MAGIYAADGSINVTVVDGSSLVEAYASDGSWNVLVSDGSNGPVRDPSGALRVTLTTDASAKRYAADGSIHVSETKLHSPLWVTAVSGSLSGGAGVAPAAPTLTLASSPVDMTPDLTVGLPFGINDGTDIQAGDVVITEVSTDLQATWQLYNSHTVGSGDLSASSVNETSAIGDLTDGTTVSFRAYISRTGAPNSDYSNIVTETLNGSAYQGVGDVVPNAQEYHGARAYTALYATPGTNPVWDVVDSAGANLTTIPIATDGFPDASVISAFISAHGTPYCTKSYDQTGNGHDRTQATVANMPTVILDGASGKYLLQFSGSQWLTDLWGIGAPTTYSVHIAAKFTSNFGATQSVMEGAPFPVFGWYNGPAILCSGGGGVTVSDMTPYENVPVVYDSSVDSVPAARMNVMGTALGPVDVSNSPQSFFPRYLGGLDTGWQFTGIFYEYASWAGPQDGYFADLQSNTRNATRGWGF